MGDPLSQLEMYVVSYSSLVLIEPSIESFKLHFQSVKDDTNPKMESRANLWNGKIEILSKRISIDWNRT